MKAEFTQILLKPILFTGLFTLIIAYFLDRYGQLIYNNNFNFTFCNNVSNEECYIIVAGCWVLPDKTPGYPLKKRIELGAQLLLKFIKFKDIKLVFTGGQGEAEISKTYAEQLGVPTSAIILENKSTTTYENAKFSYNIISNITKNKNKKLNVIVVSDTYHILRCKLLFKIFFGNSKMKLAASQSDIFNRIRGAVREVPAVLKNLLLGNLQLYSLIQEFIQQFPTSHNNQ